MEEFLLDCYNNFLECIIERTIKIKTEEELIQIINSLKTSKWLEIERDENGFAKTIKRFDEGYQATYYLVDGKIVESKHPYCISTTGFVGNPKSMTVLFYHKSRLNDLPYMIRHGEKYTTEYFKFSGMNLVKEAYSDELMERYARPQSPCMFRFKFAD